MGFWNWVKTGGDLGRIARGEKTALSSLNPYQARQDAIARAEEEKKAKDQEVYDAQVAKNNERIQDSNMRSSIADFRNASFLPGEQDYISAATGGLQRQYDQMASARAAALASSGMAGSGFANRAYNQNRMDYRADFASKRDSALGDRQRAVSKIGRTADDLERQWNEASENKGSIAEDIRRRMADEQEALDDSKGWFG